MKSAEIIAKITGNFEGFVEGQRQAARELAQTFDADLRKFKVTPGEDGTSLRIEAEANKGPFGMRIAAEIRVEDGEDGEGVVKVCGFQVSGFGAAMYRQEALKLFLGQIEQWLEGETRDGV